VLAEQRLDPGTGSTGTAAAGQGAALPESR